MTKTFHYKKPAKPYQPAKSDGHTYVRLNGGPLEGGWLRNYPPMQETFSAFGANYVLKPIDKKRIDPAYDEDRQIEFVFVGYEGGME
jgi:hypothetical protein